MSHSEIIYTIITTRKFLVVNNKTSQGAVQYKILARQTFCDFT